MLYLSIDLETTGLEDDCQIIEFAAVPFDTQTRTIFTHLARRWFIQCPAFESLRAQLNPWVVEHMQAQINYSHEHGVEFGTFKQELATYLQSPEIKNLFKDERITIFGKSLNALDLPFLNRDLGRSFMNQYFSHKVLDLSALSFGLIDIGLLPANTHSSSALFKYFQLGEVPHNALEDATTMAKIYLLLIEKLTPAPLEA